MSRSWQEGSKVGHKANDAPSVAAARIEVGLYTQRSQIDRRHSELALTKAGNKALEKLSKLAAEHEAELFAALTPEEPSENTLGMLCWKIVAQQGLTPDVLPG